MKKTLMALAAMAALVGFAGQDDLLVTLSAGEKLVYSDGKVVDNELVALVWTPAGETFGGFFADGSVAGNAKVLARVVVNGGAFPKTTFQIDATLANEMKLSQGVFTLYLLDTRGADGVAIGTKSASGGFKGVVPVNYTAKILEGTIASDGAGSVSEIKSAGGAADGRIVASGVAQLPVAEAELKPIIKSAKVEGGKFKVTIEKAVPYLKYGLKVGGEPSKLADPTVMTTPATETMTLETPLTGSCGFIQVKADRNQ